MPQEAIAERLRAARPEGDAAQQQGAVIAEQGIVLRLVREHGRVASLELELHEWREQRGDLGDDAPLVGLRPRLRHGEVDAVGVCLEQRDAARLELAAEKA